MREIGYVTLVALLLAGDPVLAQQEEAPAAAEPVAAEAEDEAGSRSVEERLAELEARDAAQEEKIAELEQKNADLQDELALGALQGDTEDFETTERLRLYGFFDLTFIKAIYEGGNPYGMYIPEASTFMMSNFNVFLQSNMTDTLSTLGELHFSYRPLGEEKDWEVEGVPGTTYERTDTEVLDQSTTSWYRQGGVDIQRLYLKYAPVDWFNVVAGHYLTPYGIWNIDHGSPVVIPVRWPWMQIRNMVPTSQMGLQVRGRLFPHDALFFDYAVTFSNGRGPIDTVMDYDENKAVGLKLKLTYHGRDVEVALGGYGYYGHYTDQKKVVHVHGISGTDETTEEQPMMVDLVVTESYEEYIVSGDLLVEVFGLRLQSEIVRTYTAMKNPPLMPADDILFAGGTGTEYWFLPSYTGFAVYGLAAYELPIADRLGGLRITPYVMAEHCVTEDTRTFLNMDLYFAGLNLKPSPFVVLKLEWMLGVPHSEVFGSNITVLSAQMAVSF